MVDTAIVGSTGLVGSHILSTLLSLPSISSIHSLSRRDPKSQNAKLHPHTSADSTTWSTHLTTISPSPTIFFSALGTTRAQAGGFAAQRLIDYDLNLALATAAKKAGVRTYVLISSGGANHNSSMGYPKMKGELEEAVKALGFERTVILRPGLIVGGREDSRPAEYAIQCVAGFAGKFGDRFKDFWAQDASVIARAAVQAGLQADRGDGEKFWMVGQNEIVRLGRTEWKE